MAFNTDFTTRLCLQEGEISQAMEEVQGTGALQAETGVRQGRCGRQPQLVQPLGQGISHPLGTGALAVAVPPHQATGGQAATPQVAAAVVGAAAEASPPRASLGAHFFATGRQTLC